MIFLYIMAVTLILNLEVCFSQANDQMIKFGMTTVLSGPNQFLGRSIRDGMLKRFDEANERDEIPGKTIELIVLDDSYDPDEAVKHAETLIDTHKVIALVGNVGTPTAARTEPLANAKSVVFYGAFTGSDILRKTPPNAYTFNFRASYEQEMEVIVDHILAQGISARRIALFLQKDSYGDAGYHAAKKILVERGFEYVDELKTVSYERNTLSVQAAVEELLRSHIEIEAIIIVGAYQASGEFIRLMHRIYPKVRFYNLSFVGAPVLAQVLPKVAKRVYMTQVVPIRGGLPECATSKEKILENFSSNSVQIEGYLAASVLVDTLKKISGSITSKSLKKALEQMGDFNTAILGNLSLSKDDHQVSDCVWLSELIHNKQWVATEKNH